MPMNKNVYYFLPVFMLLDAVTTYIGVRLGATELNSIQFYPGTLLGLIIYIAISIIYFFIITYAKDTIHKKAWLSVPYLAVIIVGGIVVLNNLFVILYLS